MVNRSASPEVIAEAFERLEQRHPHLPELVTQGHLRETELRLQNEIEQHARCATYGRTPYSRHRMPDAP